MSSVKYDLTKVEFEKRLSKAKKAGEEVMPMIHEMAMSALLHANQHNNVDLVIRMSSQLPLVFNKRGLKDWFIAFGKVQYSIKDGYKFINRKDITPENLTTKLDEANDNPFWEFSKDSADGDQKPFDVTAAIASIVRKVKREQQRNHEVKGLELMGKLEALVPADKASIAVPAAPLAQAA